MMVVLHVSKTETELRQASWRLFSVIYVKKMDQNNESTSVSVRAIPSHQQQVKIIV
jgi:hypothetical protein